MVRFSRRGILFGIAAAIAAAATSYRLWWPQPVAALSRRLMELFPEAGAAAPVLRQLAPISGLGADRQALAEAMFGETLQHLVRSPPEAILGAVAHAVDGDFREGRLVMIDGWMLAQTEARLLAFLALGTA